MYKVTNLTRGPIEIQAKEGFCILPAGATQTLNITPEYAELLNAARQASAEEVRRGRPRKDFESSGEQ